MGIKGLIEDLSEENKIYLPSETWQKVRDGMKEKKEVKHFTAENTVENAYGWAWDQVVKEYLRSGYNAENNSPDLVVMGETYKTLRRPEITVFYDAAGDTLFDVTNERLQKEYEWLMNGGGGDTAENTDTREEKDADEKDDLVVEQTEKDPEAGETSQTERVEKDELECTFDLKRGNAEVDLGLLSPETVESNKINTQNSKSVKQRAEEKLKREMEAAKDKSFAESIIIYLLKRCEEDEGVAEDVTQEHKTWQKCLDYIYRQAKQQAHGNCAAVRSDVVYEWAEDYYHKDDKAEEEKKAKKADEDRVKKAKSVTEKKVLRTKGSINKSEKLSISPQAEVPKVSPKPKKSGKEMNGQMDMFSMMGM